MRKHVVISGTVRTGTTFLVRLLGVMGLNIGNNQYYVNCEAGLESDRADEKAPDIVKNPWLCENLDAILAKKQISIEHLIVPVRDLYSAAENRRDVMRRAKDFQIPMEGISGGFWGSKDPDDQEHILALRIYNLIRTPVKYDLKLTLLDFPRIVNDQNLFSYLEVHA